MIYLVIGVVGWIVVTCVAVLVAGYRHPREARLSSSFTIGVVLPTGVAAAYLAAAFGLVVWASGLASDQVVLGWILGAFALVAIVIGALIPLGYLRAYQELRQAAKKRT